MNRIGIIVLPIKQIGLISKNKGSRMKTPLKQDGLLVGISSGAAVFAAAELAKHQGNKGKIIVTLLSGTGERYLSAPMFSEQIIR